MGKLYFNTRGVLKVPLQVADENEYYKGLVVPITTLPSGDTMVTTFLPYSDFKKTAKALDQKRLNAQRREARQIITVLEYLDSCRYILGPDPEPRVVLTDRKHRQIVFYNGANPHTTRSDYSVVVDGSKAGPRIVPWLNHTCTYMWIGHTDCLKEYYNIILQEWLERGYENSMEFYPIGSRVGKLDEITKPWWMDWEMFHKSQRAVLYQKLASHYHFLEIDPSYIGWGYIWPGNLSEAAVALIKQNPEHFPISALAERFDGKVLGINGSHK